MVPLPTVKLSTVDGEEFLLEGLVANILLQIVEHRHAISRFDKSQWQLDCAGTRVRLRKRECNLIEPHELVA